MNDDAFYLGNPYTNNLSVHKSARWDDLSGQYMDLSRGYDGVSTQAIASMLTPEFTKTRIPTNLAVRSGLVSRSQTYTMTTNASGNVIFVLYPSAITNT